MIWICDIRTTMRENHHQMWLRSGSILKKTLKVGQSKIYRSFSLLMGIFIVTLCSNRVYETNMTIKLKLNGMNQNNPDL
jgi:hypothetical protein